MSKRDRIWHAAYCRWYDHREADNALRAGLWGWTADALCRVLDRIGWGRA